MKTRDWIIGLLVLATSLITVGDAMAFGYLYIGRDTEEFGGLQDQIGRYATAGAAVGAGGLINVNYNVNGMTMLGGGQLLTGTVGTPYTSALAGQTLTTANNNTLAATGSHLADISSVSFNEDMAYDAGTNSVWHANFGSSGSGTIRQLDANNLGGAALNVYNLSFGVVGATMVGNQLWVTNWAAQTVGTFTAGVYTAQFSTSGLGNAGGLAYDAGGGVLWVGTSGGQVTPFSTAGVQLGASFTPFGSTSNTIDGLAFSPTLVPEPTSMMLLGLGIAVLAIGRKRRKTS